MHDVVCIEQATLICSRSPWVVGGRLWWTLLLSLSILNVRYFSFPFVKALVC